MMGAAVTGRSEGAATGGTAQLVHQDERAVGKVEDIELEHVAAELDSQLERFEGVLRR